MTTTPAELSALQSAELQDVFATSSFSRSYSFEDAMAIDGIRQHLFWLLESRERHRAEAQRGAK